MTSSERPRSANEVLGPFEEVVTDWQTAMQKIDLITNASQSRTSRELAWRGVTNSEFWPDNSLYRHLSNQLGKIKDPESSRPPFEQDMQNYEDRLLSLARNKWRFDHLSALEILAHVRHYGGYTRLLDVTFNPLIALWFAVEGKNSTGEDDTDVRLYAFDVTERKALLDKDWGGRELPWGLSTNSLQRKLFEDEPYWIWKPPGYNERIPAQNSAFLISRLSSLNELLWRHESDFQFIRDLSSVPQLVLEVDEIFEKLKLLRNKKNQRTRILQSREFIREITKRFEILEPITEKINLLIMEHLHLERIETGGKFQPLRIFLDGEIDVLKSLSEDTDLQSGDEKFGFEEWTAKSSNSDLKKICDEDLLLIKDIVDQLSWVEEQAQEIKNWVLRIDEDFVPASISMDFARAGVNSKPGPLTTYTIRITSQAKNEIRENLEKNYGYDASTLYPDLMGLAEKGKDLL